MSTQAVGRNSSVCDMLRKDGTVRRYVMKSQQQLLVSGAEGEATRRGYIYDTMLAIVGVALITAGIAVFHLYPRIPNISLLYLFIVLGLAITRGRYAAICGAVLAFLCFDFFLVPPLYTFSINRFEEWLALCIFLITAISTGQLASALRLRAEEATQRESETRALYNLLSAISKEERPEHQLNIIARALVSNFSFAGVRDCAILLPDANEKLALQASAIQPLEQIQLSEDEAKTAAAAMNQRKTISFYDDAAVPSPERHNYWFRRAMTAAHSHRHHILMLPLYMGQRAVGVVRLLMEETPRPLSVERNLSAEEQNRLVNSRTTFFWTFLDQAAAVIERARLHRENMQVELLKRTDALRSALLSSVSHDLRTPLASIKAAASSLLQEDVHWDEEASRSFASAIEHEADRLNHLVSNLLDMSRIEGGALKPEKEWYPLDELLHDVLGHAHTLFHDRAIRTSIADDLPPVEIDYFQIDQVMTNLLENAARYTPAGSPLDLSALAMHNELVVSLADRGPGVPPADLERIFDKFYRVTGTAHKAGSSMGTGLGLAVCRGLVEAHGGRIWAENREGGGAVFRFTLPLGTAKGHVS